jgi:hypothetical protein
MQRLVVIVQTSEMDQLDLFPTGDIALSFDISVFCYPPALSPTCVVCCVVLFWNRLMRWISWTCSPAGGAQMLPRHCWPSQPTPNPS